MEFMTTLLLVSIVGMGLYGNMTWLALIGGILLALYASGARRDKPLPEDPTKPKIRPIIVKRRYSGPESIYPSRMKIRVNPKWDTRDWWEAAFNTLGATVGIMASLGRPGAPPELAEAGE
jgi:hypothetical protein